eukprot:119125-Pyramimonas_sp.AAC.1
MLPLLEDLSLRPGVRSTLEAQHLGLVCSPLRRPLVVVVILRRPLSCSTLSQLLAAEAPPAAHVRAPTWWHRAQFGTPIARFEPP